MDRGYYKMSEFEVENTNWVAIHNKNGKGLLRDFWDFVQS